MFKYVIPLVLTLAASVRTVHNGYPSFSESAASEAQIRFAIENKYDDTGPAANQPVYAYNTYKTLEDALIGYIDDPDTKLPENERLAAIHKFVKPVEQNGYFAQQDYYGYSKPDNDYSNKPHFQAFPTRYDFPEKQYTNSKIVLDFDNDVGFSQNLHSAKIKTEPKLHKYQSVKGSALSLGHYKRDPDLKNAYDQFDPNPRYTFSYGVHDKKTGDSKSAHETRDGGTVRGYYTFIDADGKQRTVRYTADDKQGFRATVQRTQTNTQ